MKNIHAFAYCVLGLSLLPACANVGRNGSDNLNVGQYSSNGYGATNSALTAGTNSSDPYGISIPQAACGYNPNITTQDDYTDSLSTEYLACQGGSSSQVKVFPADGQSRTICVFPATNTPDYNGSNYNGYATTGINQTDPYQYQCQTTSSSGITLNFPKLNVTAIYIVAPSQARDFSVCLSTGDTEACAQAYGITYSYGTL